MTIKPTARTALRAATTPDHDKVDRAFAAFDLNNRDRYKAFLTAQASAFLPVEAALDRVDLAPVLPDWPSRRRAQALIADLSELGGSVHPVLENPTYNTIEAALGAIYVLEGSRLGGRMLARSVPASLPCQFLKAGDPTLWRKLIDVLDAILVSEDQLAVAIEAARAVFARFEAGARSHPKDVFV